jgi:hypothetical protein
MVSAEKIQENHDPITNGPMLTVHYATVQLKGDV